MIGFGEKEAEVMVNFGARPHEFVYKIHQHRWGSEDRFVDVGARGPPGTRVELPERPMPSTIAELA